MRLTSLTTLFALVCFLVASRAFLHDGMFQDLVGKVGELAERQDFGGILVPRLAGPPRIIGPPRGGRNDPPELPSPPASEDTEKPTEEDDSRFDLGEYDEGSDKLLFRNFERPADVNFFAQVYDFFAVEYGSEFASFDAYSHAENIYQPFQENREVFQDNGPRLTGQPLRFSRVYSQDGAPSGASKTILSTFHPRQADGVCGAWTSLVKYCGDAGTMCGCYSGTYYVPDMWNSLAGRCASLLKVDPQAPCEENAYSCSLGHSAYTYASYCDPSAFPTVRFAEKANAAAPTQTQQQQTQQQQPPTSAAAPASTATSVQSTSVASSDSGTTQDSPISAAATSTSYSYPAYTASASTSSKSASSGVVMTPFSSLWIVLALPLVLSVS